MKLFCYLVLGSLCCGAQPGQGSESAKATVFCYSLRCQRGLDPGGNYYLEVSSFTGSGNGELAPDFFNSGYTHSAYVRLIDELLGETFSGQLALDIPPDSGDANHDGFQDFFQVSQGITNLTSTGAYHLDFYGNGSTTVTWNRYAGWKDGSCTLTMRLLSMQSVTLTLPFEVLEYQGQLVYSPGATNVTGSVSLAQTGNTNSFMKGPVEFFKSVTDRFNDLTLLPGGWTNESEQTLQLTRQSIARDAGWPTNYYGYLEFDDDANPNTFSPYAIWMLSIDDLNDADHNGIPDFSDDPTSSTQPMPPRLDMATSGTNAVLTLHADTGHPCDIEECADLAVNNWVRVLTVTVTNDDQIVTIPLPEGPVRFWRVKTR